MLEVTLESPVLKEILYRAKNEFSDTLSEVLPIIKNVKENKNSALKEYSRKFDGVEIENFVYEVHKNPINLPYKIKNAFDTAKKNIEKFHKLQLPKNIEKKIHGNRLGIKYTPVDSVAVYAPGGKAFYPSSVLMGVLPAKLAGVNTINLFTPPSKDGKISDVLLYVSQISGVQKIYTIGGAHAIAAAAYGTETIPSHDIIVGPGNKYVAASKSYLQSIGKIGMESIAGPSEVFIIADETANAEWVACDMLSQAEHGEDSVAILATNSKDLAINVSREIEKALISRKGRGEIKSKAIYNNSHILIFPDIDNCITFSNQYAPEHLEIQTKKFDKDFKKIKHAGSVFLGMYSPVAMGDYISGTNHILPTAGLSRIYSSLGVENFLKRVTYQEITKKSLIELVPHVRIMSEIEGLEEEHGTSVILRTQDENTEEN